MKLIGMLDSPFVRRVAISLELLGVPFEHEAVSVFSTFARFQRINPVVKAPTLACDDGELLMDSSLILQFVEATTARSLWPDEPLQLQHALRAAGLALAAAHPHLAALSARLEATAAFQHYLPAGPAVPVV